MFQRTDELGSVNSSPPPLREAVADPVLWDREYRDLLVIPSSDRRSPSKSLLLFDHLIDYKPTWRVLDSGSGPGRNSIYVARKGCTVFALDFSPVALERLRTAIASNASTRSRIHPLAGTLQRHLPFAAGTFDLTIDSYVFCHALTDCTKLHIMNEYHRTLREDGLLFSVVFSLEDEYYARLLSSGFGSGQTVTDPANSISKYLYSEEELLSAFSAKFTIRYFSKFRFYDFALGSPYLRSTYVSLLQARP